MSRRRKILPRGTIRVYFMDECPAIGMGYRLVQAKVGRKWAHIECVSTGFKARLTIKAWAEISKYGMAVS